MQSRRTPVLAPIIICLAVVFVQAHPPTGIVVGPDGSVYFVDVLSHQVFKISAKGHVSIVAGSGAIGAVDGVGQQARFDHPHSLALDARGNLYVGDYDGHRVRKITPDRKVITFAGSGEVGFAEGVGLHARLERPAGLAVDSRGNLYIIHDRNDLISRITPQGATTTVARVQRPHGIAIDKQGTIFVSTNDHRILKLSADGQITIFAGAGQRGFADGKGTEAKFATPWGVAVDRRGTVYVADMYNYRVRKIAPDGTVTTLAGSGEKGFANGVSARAKFDGPCGVAVDGSGNVYVLDGWEIPIEGPKVRVRKIDPRGFVTTLVGAPK